MELFSNRQAFFAHLAQTSPSPIGIEMVKASGIYLYGADGKKYIDTISGFSVANIGHSHPEVIKAIHQQAEKYMHLIVYGEFIQQPQVAYAKYLTEQLPSSLNCVYFTNSGAEATEGAMKLAKRVTGKIKMIACHNAYHGSTQGALSVMGGEYWRAAFRPLLPGIVHVDYNSEALLNEIDAHTACVIIEPVQAESGVTAARKEWLTAIRKKCTEVGALLVFDEIQSGFGRTGTLFAFEQFEVHPDVLLLGKALGGGMPLGAFIANATLMETITYNPVLGHITTFGGHPVSCAAGMTALQILLQSNWISEVHKKQQILLDVLQHSRIIRKQFFGLWGSLQFENEKLAQQVVKKCIEKGIITDWFLFAPDCLRIAPPLCITEQELHVMANVILQSIEDTFC